MLKTLLRFRQHQFGVAADVQKAFLQIGIKPSDTLRFLLFERTPTGVQDMNPVCEYRMTRVPFGTTASPFLLSVTLQYHLQSVSGKYRQAAEKLMRCFYVDDMVTSVPTASDAFKLYDQATEIFAKAGMKLQKWATNCTDLENCVEQPYNVKILGLLWNTRSDRLSLNIDPALECLQENKPMKRFILQTSARLFNPLVLATPFLIRVKIFFQRVWQIELDWDCEIPIQLSQERDMWCREIHDIKTLSVPRFCLSISDIDYELPVFTDASKAVYGAVAYLRHNRDGAPGQVLMAKGQVASIKQLSLLRLEFLGV